MGSLLSSETSDTAQFRQRINRAFREPRRGRDQFADAVVAVCLLILMVTSQQIWQVEYSRPRMLVAFYVLVGASLLGRFWRRVPAPVAWVVGLYAGFVVVGHLTWSRAVGWIEADTVWQELRISVGLLLFAVTFGARGWVRWRWLIVFAGVVTAALQLLLILTGRTFSTSAGEAQFYGHRPFGATFALLMLAAFVILCLEPGIHSKPVTAAAVFLGCSVVLAQHRSVWVSLGVVCALILLRSLRHAEYPSARIPVLVTLAFVAVAVALPALTPWSLLPGSEGGGTGPIGSVPAAVTDSDSLSWRWEMWQSRVRTARGPLEWLFGAVLGPTSIIGPQATVRNPGFSAHNLWVDQTTMLGLVGLGLLLAMFWVGMQSVRRWPELQVFLWGLLAFGLFYNVLAWCYLLLGAAVAMAPGASGFMAQRLPDDIDDSGQRGAVTHEEQQGHLRDGDHDDH